MRGRTEVFGKYYARAVFTRGGGSASVLLFRGETPYLYTFSGGDSIPGRFFRVEALCGGGDSLLQHRNRTALVFFFFSHNQVQYLQSELSNVTAGLSVSLVNERMPSEYPVIARKLCVLLVQFTFNESRVIFN